MEDSFHQLLNVLGAKYGWLSTVVCWMGAFRIVFGQFEERLTSVLTLVANSSDPEDDRDWEAILHARWYRMVSWAIYFFLSVRLPSFDDFLALKTKNQKENLN